MPALATNSHVRLAAVQAQYAKARTQAVAIVGIGDSRTAYTRWRLQSQIARVFDLPIRSIFVTAEDTATPQMWKDGFGLAPVALTGIVQTGQFPGGTFASSGIVNNFPIALREFWSASGAAGAATGRCFLVYLTYGGQMNSSSTDASTGGNARQGSPYGAAKGIDSITVFRVTDTRSTSAWTVMQMEAGQSANNSNENSLGTSGSFLPQQSPAGTQITQETWTLPANTITAGNGVTMRYRFFTDPGAAQGFVLAGLRFTFRNNGITFYPVAVGGWSTSDHMTNPVDGITNTDAKYTDEGIRDLLRKIVTEPNIVLRVELGQNGNTPGNGLDEWNGTNSGTFGLNIRRIILDRWLRILREPEFASRSVVVQLVPHWYTAGDRGRATSHRNALLAVANEMHTAERPVAVYDQIAELEARYAATGGTTGLDDSVGLMPANAGDPVHQSFDRVIALGESEWLSVHSPGQAAPLARGLGAAPDMPPTTWQSYTPANGVQTPFVTTYVRANSGGDLAVTWADGTTEVIASFPAQRAVAMRVRAIAATGTTASGIQIGT